MRGAPKIEGGQKRCARGNCLILLTQHPLLLTGRSRHSTGHCLVSADAIASQLVRNGKYEAVDRKSSQLVSQEMSDLWRATTPDTVNISDNFSQREFTATLQHLKPGKAPVPDSLCSELILQI